MRLALVFLLLAFPALAQKPSLIRVAPFEDSRLGGLRLMKDGAELGITGLVLGIAGPLLMLTGLVVGLAAGALFPILPIALLGGAVISIGGVLFNQLGETFLLRAVNLYNLQLLEPPKRAPGFSGPAGNSSP